MCGFAGYYGAGDFNREEVIDQMGERIAHRGPDSKGSFVDDYVALGFRRLSIIDLEGGSQPIHSADGKHVIIFNGEIYNYQEIRKELIEKHGCQFQTNSDTEVILQGYKTYGEKIASMLRGMFAFVIYDKETHNLFGARDYFGIKPFYYAQMNGSLLFGSEIKSFLAHPHFHKEVNKDALKMYLIFQYTPLLETMFKGVFKLEPGTYFTYDGKELKKTKYFDPTYAKKDRSFDETVKLIGETIQDSVDYHQIADVEVGSFLSGGVDSSYIASTVKPMKTYSVGFEVGGFDETTFSKDLCDILHMSNAKKEMLYIAQDSDENRPTVKNQAADENSLYNEIKKLIKIRKEHTALLSKGEIEFVAAKKDTYPLAYVRSSEDEKILVVINPSAKEVTFEFDAKPGETIYSFGGSVESDGKTVKASGQTAAFIKLA